ncbi:SOUL family heme-binding protein [Blastopirellula retiformator]|uniref:SOUL heme-binding protein n=1 Tax=Blastopirellula retiformator TaxID=2527970 RepID=A0A5C5V8F3_9BACT|nr:heme-binding protein [Blastopirellula retiformator]TWT34127.1 SOUL heme-binding protein [Blastopirellula retiformator]
MKKLTISALGFGVVAILTAVAMAATRAGYESAEYKVIESDGAFEIREYPDLTLAATEGKTNAQGRNGSFMRLFRYISGKNQAQQAIEMTTPVFMEGGAGESAGSMGFVMPKEVAAKGAPQPKEEGVTLKERKGGRFAVIRFAGQLSAKLAQEKEAELRGWMKKQDLKGEEEFETAGYDPPFTPAALRRNEVLIRLKAAQPEEVTEAQ